MSTPLDIIGEAIESVVKLGKMLSHGNSIRVTAKDERTSIKALALAWFNSLRPTLDHPASAALLGPLDITYNELLDFSDKSTSRARYKSHTRTLKAELVRFRSQITVLTASGQIPTHQKPDFSKLVSNSSLLEIIDRRWDETSNCIEGAPLAAVIMIGALLEALLLSRIERESNKTLIFKLKCTPKDKLGKAKKLTNWTLSNYINACFELGWIRKPVRDVGSVLRDYRNLIHPREELKQNVSLNSDDAKMYWAVFSTMAEQIVDSV